MTRIALLYKRINYIITPNDADVQLITSYGSKEQKQHYMQGQLKYPDNKGLNSFHLCGIALLLDNKHTA